MTVRLALLAVLALCLSLPAVSPAANTAVNDWRQEFADVCGHTQQAMTLSDGDLKDYVRRCEELQERIGELGETEDPSHRLYAKRLRMCKDFYNYILEFRKQEK